jgi:16S rRNA C967 or C1407 C5-methylase (RsmB/RsmF family)
MIDRCRVIFERYKEIIPDYQSFLEAVQRPRLRIIRVNSLRVDRNVLIERLSSYGVELKQIPWYKNAFIVIEGRDVISKTLEYYMGLYYIMDLVSLLPVYILSKYIGRINLDIAAAPGGKALAIAELIYNNGILIANEPNKNRLKALISNIDRFGYNNIIVTSYDGRRFPLITDYSTVLFDAPCSNEGRLHKVRNIQPYLKGIIYKRYSRLQSSILKHIYNIIPVNSTVLYCVCTINPLECENIVSEAMKIGFKIEEIPRPPMKYVEGIIKWDNYKFVNEMRKTISIYPHLTDEYHNTGLMYIALLRK